MQIFATLAAPAGILMRLMFLFAEFHLFHLFIFFERWEIEFFARSNLTNRKRFIWVRFEARRALRFLFSRESPGNGRIRALD